MTWRCYTPIRKDIGVIDHTPKNYYFLQIDLQIKKEKENLKEMLSDETGPETIFKGVKNQYQDFK